MRVGRIPPFRFSKPKGPGFGIAKNYYFSVLGSSAVLPSISSIIHPDPKESYGPMGTVAPVEGFGVPMVQGNDKSLLELPMQRGQFALSTKNQQTVLRLMVLPAYEAGFRPEPLLQSPLASALAPEVLNRVRATQWVMQVTFESHDPEVYPALDFFLQLARRISDLSEGVVADPLAVRYLLPNQLLLPMRYDPKVDSREHIGTHEAVLNGQSIVFTRGLVKFAMPEYALTGISADKVATAKGFLLGLAQGNLLGTLVKVGGHVPAPGGSTVLKLVEDPSIATIWEGAPGLRLQSTSDKAVNDLL